MASVPVGLLIGFVEFLVGASLLNFLNVYGLIPLGKEIAFLDLMKPFNPTVLLILIAFLLFLLRFAAQVIPSLANEWYMRRIREVVAVRSLGGFCERLSIPLPVVTDILGNLAPRAGGLVVASSQIVSSVLMLCTTLVIILMLSWQLTLIILAVSSLLAVPAVLMRRKAEKYHEFIAAHTTSYTERVIKYAQNVHFLKMSGANEAELDALLQLAKNITYNIIQWSVRFAAKVNIPAFLSVIAGIILIIVNSKYNYTSSAVLVPFVYMLSRLSGAVSVIFSSVASAEYAYPFARRLSGFYDDLFAERNASDFGALECPRDISEIKVKDLVVGRTEALNTPLSFAIKNGEMLLLQGQSGRGKTTLIMTMVGMVAPVSGEVLWGSVPVRHFDPKSLRSTIGYAAPEPYLFHGSIRSNLEFGNPGVTLTQEIIDQALWCAGAEFINEFQGGIDFELHDNGEGISAGQRQRISLARSLLRSPDVLILDEATANIDEDTEEIIMNRIFQTFPDIIVLAVSHRASMKRFATEVVKLEQRQ